MSDSTVTVPVELVRDLHWMARRYADGRASYATSTFNGHTRTLLALGVSLNLTGDETIWARDAMGRGCDHLTGDEAAMGRTPDWWHTEPDAREQIDALTTALSQIIAVLGPTPCRCSGQQEEVAQALKIARASLVAVRGAQDGEGGA